MLTLCTFAIQKNRCWNMLSQDLYHFLCLEQYHKCFSYSSLFYIIYAYFVFTVCVWLSCKTQLTGRSDKDVEKIRHFCCILLRGAVCLAAKPMMCLWTQPPLFFLFVTKSKTLPMASVKWIIYIYIYTHICIRVSLVVFPSQTGTNAASWPVKRILF